MWDITLKYDINVQHTSHKTTTALSGSTSSITFPTLVPLCNLLMRYIILILIWKALKKQKWEQHQHNKKIINWVITTLTWIDLKIQYWHGSSINVTIDIFQLISYQKVTVWNQFYKCNIVTCFGWDFSLSYSYLFSLNSIYFWISIYTWQHTSIQIHGKWIGKQVT